SCVDGFLICGAAAPWAYPLSLHDALPIFKRAAEQGRIRALPHFGERSERKILEAIAFYEEAAGRRPLGAVLELSRRIEAAMREVDRKSTRLNSSHVKNSYAVFCLKKTNIT